MFDKLKYFDYQIILSLTFDFSFMGYISLLSYFLSLIVSAATDHGFDRTVFTTLFFINARLWTLFTL